ncbi:MAG: 16S rRNA (uracil(1498)-N(3))-methyltransferase [Actinomycetota bacterium]|nr:16S rRNA (uracil(1498)-N(3))-methyltransferase [Actinomycetota bacterium]
MTSRSHEGFFYVEPGTTTQASRQVVIDKEQSRHLALVRRARVGDRIQICDGEGTVAIASLESVGKMQVSAKIESSVSIAYPRPAITILQGLAKGAKVDLVVQKLTELGVDRIVIFESQRSIPAWDQGKAERALERWRSISFEAAKQSRRAWLPKVEGPLTFEEAALLADSHAATIVAHGASATSARKELSKMNHGLSDICVVIGPEGGLSLEEVSALEKGSAVIAGFGPNTMRTETAAIVIAALVMYELGRLDPAT